MTATERWARTEHLFGKAIELPPEARASFIEAHAADAEERQELLELLATDADHADACPISQAIGRAADHTAQERKRGLIGKVVGQYRVAAILGSGGSGTVYLGERADKQYAAQVAITRPYFDAKVEADEDEFTREADRHPVFELHATSDSRDR